MPPPIPGGAARAALGRGLSSLSASPALSEAGSAAARLAAGHARPLKADAYKVLGDLIGNVRRAPPRSEPGGYGKVAEGIRSKDPETMNQLASAFQEISCASDRRAGLQLAKDKGLADLLGPGADPQIKGHFASALEAVLPREKSGDASPTPLKLAPPRGKPGGGNPGLRALPGMPRKAVTPEAEAKEEDVMRLRGGDGEHLPAPPPPPPPGGGHVDPMKDIMDQQRQMMVEQARMQMESSNINFHQQHMIGNQQKQDGLIQGAQQNLDEMIANMIKALFALAKKYSEIGVGH
jgi:hypothetical protein